MTPEPPHRLSRADTQQAGLIALRAAFAGRVDRMLAEMTELVGIDSPSADEESLRVAEAWLLERLASLGEVSSVGPPSGGAHVVLRSGVNPSRGPLIVCHYDTVWPRGTAARRPVRQEDGRVYGPGLFDMKASIVTVAHCLEVLDQMGAAPSLELLITCDEEIGSPTGRDAIADRVTPGRVVLILEPPLPGGSLKVERKGIETIEISVSGRAAHAGVDPEAGASAIEEAAKIVGRLAALRDGRDDGSIVVGTLTGGTASNVVAAHAVLEVDIRAWRAASLEALTAAVLAMEAEAPGISLSFARRGGRPPLEHRPGSGQLLSRFAEHAALAGLTIGSDRTGGVSDGNIVQALGGTVLDGLGLRGAGAHAEHEHIELDHLVPHAAALTSFLDELTARE